MFLQLLSSSNPHGSNLLLLSTREYRLASRILRLYKLQLMLYQNAHPLAKPAAFARADVLFARYMKLVEVPKVFRPPPERGFL